MDLSSLPHDSNAAVFWSERAQSEAAAVAAFQQLGLAMWREGFPWEAQRQVVDITAEEMTHAELCRDVAQALGGYVEAPHVANPRAVAAPQATTAVLWLVGCGCVSETVSTRLIHARLRATRPAALRGILESILAEESGHSRFCWQMATDRVPRLDPGHQQELWNYVEALFLALRSSFSTELMEPAQRRVHREIRISCCASGLGSAHPDEEDAIVQRTEIDVRNRLLKICPRT